MEPWRPYLREPVDHSDTFRERVAALARTIAAELDAEVRHDADTRYPGGHRLTVFLDADGAPTEDQDAASTMVKAAVSARGPLWTFLAWRQESPRYWAPFPVGDIPGAQAKTTLAAIETTLTGAGLAHVPESHLDDEAPGCRTTLDDAPATIRDALFCEVC
jgi:hypothetical protein